MYSLTDQIRRSSRSIGANIAEAWAKRRYERHFVSKLTDADGEQMETQHWVLEAFRCGYLSADDGKSITAELKRIGELLNGMMEKARAFAAIQQTALAKIPPSTVQLPKNHSDPNQPRTTNHKDGSRITDHAAQSTIRPRNAKTNGCCSTGKRRITDYAAQRFVR
jgi:four helix bundle protein